MRIHTFAAANGVPFTVELDDRPLFALGETGRGVIRFYDARRAHPSMPHELGRLASDYYVETLMSDRAALETQGLNLHGGVPSWSIDGATMRDVFAWLDGDEVDPDALDFARETLGPDATDAEVRNLVDLRADRDERERDDATTCRHCGRRIVNDDRSGWIDPEATGDDSVWRETCDENHEDRIAAHEPA